MGFGVVGRAGARRGQTSALAIARAGKRGPPGAQATDTCDAFADTRWRVLYIGVVIPMTANATQSTSICLPDESDSVQRHRDTPRSNSRRRFTSDCSDPSETARGGAARTPATAYCLGTAPRFGQPTCRVQGRQMARARTLSLALAAIGLIVAVAAPASSAGKKDVFKTRVELTGSCKKRRAATG
jgi:hypothetical protein